MKDEVRIYSGPSLHPTDLARFPGLDFHPPVARGDILRALQNPPRIIGIIDGFFGDRPAVLHKEILEALALGVQVFGAASMGALRACELDTFGMIGIGHIYRAYCEGELTSDASVAVAHGPADLGYPVLSLAEVDVLATLRALLVRGHLTKTEAHDIADAARAIHYADRSWKGIAERVGGGAEAIRRLATLLSGAHVEAKRLDAIELLNVLNRHRIQDIAPRSSDFHPPLTPSYRRALQAAALN